MQPVRISFSGPERPGGKLEFSLEENPVLCICGKRASGKTTALRMLKLAFAILSAKDLNSLPDARFFVMLAEEAPVRAEAQYWLEGELYTAWLYRLVTEIRAGRASGPLGGPVLQISREELYRKSADGEKTSWKKIRDRKEAGPFLAFDISIIIAQVREGKANPVLFSCTSDSENAVLDTAAAGKAACFLDDSIEYLYWKSLDGIKQGKWHLKFRNRKKEYTAYNFDDLSLYLSSSTLKGIRLFMLAEPVWKQGGFLLADDLEDGLDSDTVKDFICLFKNPEVNTAGGRLIWTARDFSVLDGLAKEMPAVCLDAEKQEIKS